MSSSEELASKFEAKNGEFLKFVEGLSDDQWRKTCPGEGWTVGVTAHHVAESIGTLAGLVQAVASGATIPPITQATLDSGNAEHAARAANVTRAETAKLLGGNLAAGAKVIRGLDAGQLQRTATLPFGELSAEQIIEGIMIGHTGMHNEGIRSAAAS